MADLDLSAFAAEWPTIKRTVWPRLPDSIVWNGATVQKAHVSSVDEAAWYIAAISLRAPQAMANALGVQSLDAYSLDTQELDAYSLDAQELDAYSLDAYSLDAYSADAQYVAPDELDAYSMDGATGDSFSRIYGCDTCGRR